MAAGLQIARAVNEFEELSHIHRDAYMSYHHKQAAKSQQETFVTHVSSLVTTVEEMSNPFMDDSNDVYATETLSVCTRDVAETIQTVEATGQNQCKTFSQQRLVSYIPKHRKAVLLLSTQHRNDAVMPDDSRKPQIINYYNTTKCGVDVLDHMYSCKRANHRWTVSFFFNLLVQCTGAPDYGKSRLAAQEVRRAMPFSAGIHLVTGHVSARLTLP